jgi:hypothetical protein
MKNIDIKDLKFNLLPKDVRLKALKPTFYNPFEVSKEELDKLPMLNPFSMQLLGNWDDGEHIAHEIMSLKIYRKLIVKDGNVVKVWKVNDNNQYELVEPRTDGTWDVDLF